MTFMASDGNKAKSKIVLQRNQIDWKKNVKKAKALKLFAQTSSSYNPVLIEPKTPKTFDATSSRKDN